MIKDHFKASCSLIQFYSEIARKMGIYLILDIKLQLMQNKWCREESIKKIISAYYGARELPLLTFFLE